MPVFSTLFDFNNANATNPTSNLFSDAAGNLFYTASGAVNNQGSFVPLDQATLLEIPKTGTGYASTPTALINFSITFAFDPVVLIADEAGNLFGTTEESVFEIAKTATGYASTPTTLVTLPYPVNPGILTTDAAGDLFDTTGGSLFEVAKTATGYASTPTLFPTFGSVTQMAPNAGWTADAAGDLFNTVATGEANGYGGVVELTKTATGYASTLTVLASFNNADGSDPTGGLVVDANGDLFGTTQSGSGANQAGTVFEIAKTASGYATTPTTLVSFNTIDGSDPMGGLIIDAAGDLFGTTSAGGMDGLGSGTVFEIANTGSGYASTPTTLANFFNYADGLDPKANLITDGAGDLFGRTSKGGTYGEGSVFEIANSGFQTVSGGAGLTASSVGTFSTIAGGATPTLDAGSASGAFTVPAGAADYVTSEGDNAISATSGAPTISASAGNPLIFAGNASLDFIGGSGTATVIGGSAGNTVQGGSGGLLLFAVGALNFTPGSGTSAIIGGAGGVTATLGTGGGSLYGGAGGVNTLAVAAGDAENAVLVGVGNGDVLTGAQDVFFGGAGADCMAGGAGASIFLAGSGNETLSGSAILSDFDFIAGSSARMDTIDNFNTQTDFINLFGYGSTEAAQACATAVVTSSGTTVTLPDNTTILLAGYTGALQPYVATYTYTGRGQTDLTSQGNVASA
jgi:hypothetical protein